jgi:hypothetical protein
MVKKTEYDKSGIKKKKRPHLGDIIIERYGKKIKSGYEELERFELIDHLIKPVLHFKFTGTKRIIIEVYDLISEFPYAFFIRTKMGTDIWHLPEQGTKTAHVYISRFMNFIVFIRNNENNISDDMWGLLYGYPLSLSENALESVEDLW